MKFLRLLLLSLVLSTSLVQAQESIPTASVDDAVLYDFRFVDTELSSVFSGLAVTAGIDIIVAQGISNQRVSLKVTQKSWQEILRVICKLYELTWTVQENYVYIMRKSEYEAKIQKEWQKKNEEDMFAPLVRRNYPVYHAKASDLANILRGMMGPRGTFSVVERNNALIVMDTEDRLIKIEKTLQELDVPTKQVVITAKLMIVDSRLIREMGVDWTSRSGQGNLLTEPENSGALLDETSRQAWESRSRFQMTNNPAGNPGLSANPHTSIAMGLLDGNLGLTLNYLMSDQATEILASPQISTLDHMEAELFMGDRVPLRTVSAQGVVGTRLVQAGIKLVVTPHVNGNDNILMELQPENNTYVLDASGQPIISTQRARTNVVVRNGETAVIAGLTQNQESEIEGGIPFLKDLPLVGVLFRYTKKEIKKKDLIILVTPRIVNFESEGQEHGRKSPEMKSMAVPVLAPAAVPTAPDAEPVAAPLPESVVPSPEKSPPPDWADLVEKAPVAKESQSGNWGEEEVEDATRGEKIEDDGWE